MDQLNFPQMEQVGLPSGTLYWNTLISSTVNMFSSGNVLTYNGSNWTNQTPNFVFSVNTITPSSGAFTLNLSNMNDTTITSPSANQILQYVGGTTNKWENANPTFLNSINTLTGTSNNLTLNLENLNDVSISSPSNGQVRF